jgi:CheY-like chemotaxis protein
MEELLRAAVSKHAELRFELTADPCTVEADTTQIRQVVMNLVTNASEAIGTSGGTITIRTGEVQADAESLRSPYMQGDLPGGPYAFLEVVDTGCGMTSATMEKIFDPFFTTKFIGRGLGLAAARGIAQAHQGVVQVRSEPGKGSTFRFLLPCSTKPRAAPEVPRESGGWRGTGTVLVVDDEAEVRAVVSRFLEEAGFTPLQAEDGQAGLTLFREHQQEIIAALLDLTMPRMGGLELAAALRGLRPDIPVILMSGYTVNEVTGGDGPQGFAAFVQKPFDPAALLAAVRQALGK